MAKAYLKINVIPGKERIVRSSLSQIKGVKEADITTGDQDIIALVQAENLENILKLVITKLRMIEGVTKTDTNLILE